MVRRIDVEASSDSYVNTGKPMNISPELVHKTNHLNQIIISKQVELARLYVEAGFDYIDYYQAVGLPGRVISQTYAFLTLEHK